MFFTVLTALCYVTGVKGLFLLCAGRNVKTMLSGFGLVAVSFFVFIHAVAYVQQP